MFFKLFTSNFQEMFLLLLKKIYICQFKKINKHFMTKSSDFFKNVCFQYISLKSEFLLNIKKIHKYFFLSYKDYSTMNDYELIPFVTL